MVRGDEYDLLDAGDGRRLERFGRRVVDRPAASAFLPPRLPTADWAGADLRFDRERGWTGAAQDAWTIAIDGLTIELRPTAAGQLGFYPEHMHAWSWLRQRLHEQPGAAVLNLFAHTGATTLALARAGARVTHVDASRPAVAWARRNAEVSSLVEAPIRWIVDDALRFVEREARRGRRYDGLVLDPPSFGHGPHGSRWELERALPELLEACNRIAANHAFVLLTAHSTGLSGDDVRVLLVDAFEPRSRAKTTVEPLDLVAASGAVLPLGFAARMIRR